MFDNFEHFFYFCVMANQNDVIGLFDSGIGGTTIWKEVVQLIPFESTLFLADSKNAPYGAKSKDEIIALCEKNTDFLLTRHAKIIVVACNTATTNAIAHLRQKYSKISFIGIEPAIKSASLQTKTKKVGVLATKGTLSSELFLKTSTISVQQTGITVVESVGEGLVQLIEQGKKDSEELLTLLKSYVEPMVAQNIDCLVLGCTHYPYLINQLKKILPENIQIIDSGLAVARQTKSVLAHQNLLNMAQKKTVHQWLTNGNVDILASFAHKMKNLTINKHDF